MVSVTRRVVAWAAMAVIKLAWMSGVADQDKSHAVTTDASRVYLGLFSKKAELI